MQVSDRLVTALRWQVSACTVSLWRGCCLSHSLVSFATWNTLQYCFQNLHAQSQQKESRDSNIKCLQGSWQQSLCQRNLACLNSSSWEGWFFPLSPPLSIFLFFLVSHHILRFESLWVLLLSTMKHRDTFYSCWTLFFLGIWLSKGDLFAFGEFTQVYTASDLHTKNAPFAHAVGKQKPFPAGPVTGGGGCCPVTLGQ